MAHLRRINPDKEGDGTIHPLQCPKERVLHNPRLTVVDGKDVVGMDVRTEPIVADGYEELCKAVHVLRDHEKAGVLAVDVLSHLVTAFSQDPHAMGTVLDRVRTTLRDAERLP